MKLDIAAATELVLSAMMSAGFDADEAQMTTDQIIGCELRGLTIGGLSRALSIIERVHAGPDPTGRIEITRETPVSALINGHDNSGYIVAPLATKMAIEKATRMGLAAVGAYNSWYTGMFSHYMDIATRAGLVALCVGSSAPRVAPYGSSEGRFGTNPIAFGFPTADDPIILDFGTSKIMMADCVLSERLKQPLKEDSAYDRDGHPTTDPFEAVLGAFQVFGGHKGSGLAIAIQMLGIMVGGGLFPPDNKESAFFIICIRPDLFGDARETRERFSEYAAAVRTARPLNAASSVRMPYDRSAANVRKHLAQGWFETSESLVEALRALARR